MKIVYLANSGPMDGWAHTVQIMKMCEAFCQNNLEIVLLTPKRRKGIIGDPFELYSVKNKFKIVELPYIDIFFGNTNKILYAVRFFSFLIVARLYLAFNSYDILYTRELKMSIFFRRVFVELHSFPNKIGWLNKIIFKHIKGFVVLTEFIKNKIIEIGIAENKILVSPDAVRISDFENSITVTEAKSILKMPENISYFGYVGTLKTMDQEKGVDTAVKALQYLPPNIRLYVVGGEVGHVEEYQKLAESLGVKNRVLFTGKVGHKEIPINIAACDVVVAPFPFTEHYAYYMSPLKIFEYMAAKRPMVVSDLPSLREVLKDGQTALFVQPYDTEGLALAIQKLIEDKVLANHISETAYKSVVNKYTWEKRAKNIINFTEQF